MPTILRDLPFSENRTEAEFDGRYIPIKADQIMVWVGITEGEQTEFDPRRPVFPAILDTGLSHSFSIRAEHLIRWAGLDPRWLEREGEVQIGEEIVPLYQADVWLHPNVPGKRDRAAGIEPFRFGSEEGIAVYPTVHVQRTAIAPAGTPRPAARGPPPDDRWPPMRGHAADARGGSGSSERIRRPLEQAPPYFAARSPFRSRSALSHRSTSGMQATGPGSGKSRGARISSAWLAWRMT